MEKRVIGGLRPKIEPLFAKLCAERPNVIAPYLRSQFRAQLGVSVKAQMRRLNARAEIGVGYWNNEHSNEL